MPIMKFFFSVFPTGCGKIRGKMFKKNANPPSYSQKLYTFVKQFILKFEEILQIRGKLETLFILGKRRKHPQAETKT